MSLRLADWLGAPPGWPGAGADVAVLRHLLLLVVALWVVHAFRRRASTLVWGLVFAAVALGFWVLTLGRPYGLLVDAARTRALARLAVSLASGAGEGVVAGTPGTSMGAWLARLGSSLELGLWLPTVGPMLALPAIAVAILLLWRRSERAPAAFVLWLGASTLALEAGRGVGFVSESWPHAEAVPSLVGLVVAVLLLARLGARRLATAAAAVACGLWWPLSAGLAGSRLSLWECGLVLSLDQWLLLPLAAAGLRRERDPAAVGLVAGGAALLVANGLGLGPDAWGAHALARLGLVLAASGPALELGSAVLRRALGADPDAARRRAIGLLVAALLPGAFVTWWNPGRIDPVAAASLEPVSSNLVAAMRQVRDRTRAAAVVVASPEYAEAVAALAGRRVLRAPRLHATDDDSQRVRVEQRLLEGHCPQRLVGRYGVSHLLLGPGDTDAWALAWDTRATGLFEPVFQDAWGFGLFALRPGACGASTRTPTHG